MKPLTIHIPATFAGELNGRLLVFFDKPQNQGDLYTQIGMEGCPFFGCTYYGLHGGDRIEIRPDDAGVEAFPASFSSLKKTKYRVQALFVRYRLYERSDGVRLWGMEDHGGGGNVARNPYNLYSDIKTFRYGKESVQLSLCHEILPEKPLQEKQVSQQGNYEDSERVKYFKVKSRKLSHFWNQDMYIGLNILLPRNYKPSQKYPTLYWHGHWPGGGAPLSYGVCPEDEFTAFWEKEAPEMFVVSIRNANMFYDDSYLMNSANLGPWGDAFIEEVIPAFEKEFGAVAEPWARINAGGSTGGWESMALQIFYPAFFGGSWPMCPDGMDFRAFQLINLYRDKNAYEIDYGWYKTERPACRDTRGNILWTVRQENQFELALGGDKAHGLGQWGIWEAVYGPVGKDGYPAPVWDAKSGKIHKKVVAYWKEHFDLRIYLQKHKEIYPLLQGKIHLRGGDMDNYYLNLSQYLLADFLEKKKLGGYSKTFPGVGHSGNISPKELIWEIYRYMEERKNG